MRTFYDNNGIDATTTVKNYLTANRAVMLADLYWIQYMNPMNNTFSASNLFYTSAAFPVAITNLQTAPSTITNINATYTPANIVRGQLEYAIGLEDKSFDFTFYPNDSQNLPNPGSFTSPINFKQAVGIGAFDEATFYLHRAVFQITNNKVGSLLGTTLMWRGMLSGFSEIARDRVKLQATSLLDRFQKIKIPTQIIGAGSRLPAFMPVGFAGTVQGPLITSTSSDLQFTVSGGTNSVADHHLRDFFMIPANSIPSSEYIAINGNPMFQVVRIRDNETISGVLHIYPYEPFFIPIDYWRHLIYISYFPAIDATSSNYAPGFPSVPVPEEGI